MKMVSGSVVSSKPVSLSKAARILSKFASSDNGTSPAFAAYLKRASASFDELVQLHKEFKGSGSEHKGKKHLFSGNVPEVTANNVKELTEDGLQGVEKRDSNQRKRHKGGKSGEGEDREFDRCVKIDDEELRDKKRKDKWSVDGNVSGDGKKLESNNAIVDHVMVADVNKNDNERLDRDRDSKKKKDRDKGKENIVALVKIGKEEQTRPPDRTASIGKTSEIEKQDLSEETKKNKKKKNRDKGGKENFDAVMIETEEEDHNHGQNGSNKKLCEIDKEDGSEKMKVEKKNKKRHGGQNKKSDGLIDVEKEEPPSPPDQNDGFEDATEFVENDGAKQKKHKKKKKSKEDGERGPVVVVDVEPRYSSDGGVDNEHEAETINNHVEIKSGEGKKYKKNRNHLGNEGEIGSGVEMEAANEN